MITLYTQKSCPQCEAVKKLLKEKKIEYVECTDVQKMISLGISYTPVLEVNDNLLRGKDIYDYIKGVI